MSMKAFCNLKYWIISSYCIYQVIGSISQISKLQASKVWLKTNFEVWEVGQKFVDL